jgi:hypothetical protein
MQMHECLFNYQKKGKTVHVVYVTFNRLSLSGYVSRE